MLCDAYPRTAKGCAGHGLLTLRDHETPVCWSLPDAHGRGILQPSVCWRCYSDTNAPKVALEDSDEAALLEIVVGNVADPLVDRIRGGVGQICVEHDMFGTSMEGCLRCVRGNSGTVTMTPKRGRRVHRADARNTVRRGAEPRERNRFVGDPEPELSSSEAANDEVCNPIGRMVRGCLEMKGPYPVQNEFSIGGRREPRGTPGIGHLQDAEPVQAHRRINNTACAIGPRGGERGSGGGFAIDSEQWPDLCKRNCELRGRRIRHARKNEWMRWRAHRDADHDVIVDNGGPHIVVRYWMHAAEDTVYAHTDHRRAERFFGESHARHRDEFARVVEQQDVHAAQYRERRRRAAMDLDLAGGGRSSKLRCE